jgi:CRISPR-associated endoribonuclease Cas6
MRLVLTLTPNTEPVPFNHLHRLIGTLHKWAGADNALHDGPSLHSFGWLDGGRAQDGALTFPDGAEWRLSFYRVEDAASVREGILQDTAVFAGMRVASAERKETPRFSARERFRVDAPVIARRQRRNRTREYLLYDDERADASLTRTLRAKMREACLEAAPEEASVAFDRSYEGARTKLATIEKQGADVHHKGSLCPVVVEGPPEAVRFAWNVGVGELTGSGFGALR